MTSIMTIAERLSKTMGTKLCKLNESIQAFSINTELWAFVESSYASTFHELSQKTDLKSLNLPSRTSFVHLVINNKSPQEDDRIHIDFGFEGITLKAAIHKILNLPDTFQETQSKLISSALDPVSGLPGGAIKMRTLDLTSTSHSPIHKSENALETLLDWIKSTQSGENQKNLLFIEAEAGKGKTILLASTAKHILENEPDKLAIYIPLRNLPLATGVGWDNIAQLIGVVGLGSERLAEAARSGLIILLLDGIDEVSGRYDRKTIKELLELLASKLSGPSSMVVLSGRKTEAKNIEKDSWDSIGLELPDVESSEFRRYVDFVIDKLISNWNDIIKNIPEEYSELLGKALIDEQVRREKNEISEWITDVFPVVGKDASLFFVQGLAAIAIGRRAGNRLPLKNGKSRFIPTLGDVCTAAAVFACLREQTKIDYIAESEYSASKQMQVLAGFSLLSSSSGTKALPTPNELTATIFNVNTINDSEVYVAITRQNAKHALLYATEAVGNFQPHFLSDWVRCSFSAHILKENSSVGCIDAELSRSIIASADRSRYVFSSFLPDMLPDASVPTTWINSLNSEINKGSESASANFWQLRAAVGDEKLSCQIPNPLAFAQIDQAEFVGNKIGSELSGESYFLDGSTFESVNIEGVTLIGVSMQDVKFRDCTLKNVQIQDKCEGPIYFERCTLESCTFHNMTSSISPALNFIDCIFEGTKNSITQDIAAFGETKADSLVYFNKCITDDSTLGLVQGDWLHIKTPPEGLKQREPEKVNPVTQCLREMLNTFFPSRMGSGPDIQARRYIRLSALGRGRMPAGSPSADELKSILESIGFADGGRPDHLYAPWSSVLGGNEDDRKKREEIIDFLLYDNCNTPTIQALLRKIERFFN